MKVEAQLLSPAQLNINKTLKESIRHLSNTISDTNIGSVTNIVKHIKAILKK